MNNFLKSVPALAIALAVMGCERDTVTNYIDQEVYEDFGFYRRSDMALVEVTLPDGYSADGDEIYIAGAFNGGEEAFGDTDYLLTSSERLPGRYGVYLDPDKYKDGAKLEDGFWFISGNSGREVDTLGVEVVHCDTVGLAQRAVVSIAAWETTFVPRNENVTHDGPVVYVKDETGWSRLLLNVSGEAGNSQIEAKGPVSVQGGKWKYFDMGAGAAGKEADLTFGNGETSLAAVHVTLDSDLYYTVTASGVNEASAFPLHSGIRIYVDDKTGWDATALYLYGDANDLGGTWPGIQPSGSISYKGYDYTIFTVSSSAFGLGEYLIFNNNGGGTQLPDYHVDFTDGVSDYFFMITQVGAVEVDPDKRTGAEIDLEITTQWAIYVLDRTGWDGLNVYYWGDSYVPLSWPGVTVSSDIAVTVNDLTWYKIDAPSSASDKSLSFIFSNTSNTDTRVTVKDFFTLDGDKYVMVTSSGAEAVDPDNFDPDSKPEYQYTMYIDDQSGYPGLTVYYWWKVGSGTQDNQTFPGEPVTETTEIGGVSYKTLKVLKAASDSTVNFQFVSTENTKTKVKKAFIMDKDLYVKLTSSSAELIDRDVTLYVDNQVSIWKEAGLFYLYVYGGTLGNNYTGAWPGQQFEGTAEKDGVTWYKFTIPDALGGTCKLQFSNDSVAPKTRIKSSSEMTLSSNEIYLRIEDGNSVPVILQ